MRMNYRSRQDFQSDMRLLAGAAAALLLTLNTSVAVGLETSLPRERDDCQRLFFPLSETASGDAHTAAHFLSTAKQQWEAGNPQAAFQSIWQAHRADASNPRARRILALPTGRTPLVRLRPGRQAPAQLRWQRGRYLEAETPHFVVYSTADREATIAIAEDLERFYWIWTQVFFPLWEDRHSIGRALEGATGLGTGSRPFQVVLCRDRRSYNRTLSAQVAGIEQSAGFYSDALRSTFLFAGPPHDPATRYHELTHQLLREATRARIRGGQMPGDRSDFWLVEGIATYMESVRFAPRYALVGGWESPRLQYARYRWLAGGDSLRLQDLVAEGRSAVQRRDDLARWYAHAAAYTHWFMDGGQPKGREAVFGRLAELYEIPLHRGEPLHQTTAALQVEQASQQMASFLRLSDERIGALDPQIPLTSLCLGRTDVTAAGLQQLPPQTELRWLDLSHLPIDSDDIRRLVPQPASLAQLNLEATQVDDGLSDWLAQTRYLSELDLSLTAVTDQSLRRLPTELPLATLWLTGSQVSDATVDRLTTWEDLQSVDVQQTQVSEQAVDRLRRLRPTLNVNPLQLIPAP